jgi:hypothetical protein
MIRLALILPLHYSVRLHMQIFAASATGLLQIPEDF